MSFDPAMQAVPTLTSCEHTNTNERSISAWKAKYAGELNGRHYVKITEDSDGNEQFAGKIFPIVRFEFSGGKVIFDIKNGQD